MGPLYGDIWQRLAPKRLQVGKRKTLMSVGGRKGTGVAWKKRLPLRQTKTASAATLKKNRGHRSTKKKFKLEQWKEKTNFEEGGERPAGWHEPIKGRRFLGVQKKALEMPNSAKKKRNKNQETKEENDVPIETGQKNRTPTHMTGDIQREKTS